MYEYDENNISPFRRAMENMITEIDRHFPYYDLEDKWYEDFYDEYVIPIIEAEK